MISNSLTRPSLSDNILQVTQLIMSYTVLNVLNKEVTIEVQKRKKGVFWAYVQNEEVASPFYGPFKDENTARMDAKLYSEKGSTRLRM